MQQNKQNNDFGLFTNPQDIQRQYMQQGMLDVNRMVGSKDGKPLYSLDDKIWAMGVNSGQMLGTGIGMLLGGKAPGQREAEAAQGAIQGLDFNDPRALLGAAQQLSQTNPQAAFQLYQRAQEQDKAVMQQQTDQLRLSDAQQKAAAAEQERARQAQVDAAVAALPEDATEDQIMKATFPLMTPQERATYAKGRQEETTKTTRQANASKLIDSQFPNLSPELKEFVLNDNKLLNQMLDASIRGPAERAKFQAGLPSAYDKKVTSGGTGSGGGRGGAGKAPSGYRWTADGTGLEPIPGGPADKGDSGDKASADLEGNLRANELFKETANEAMSIIDSGAATGSGIGRRVDELGRFVGITTSGAMGAQQLKVLAGRLTAAVPRMQGPQSDKDVQLYREMAGQVGDENLTLEERKAALQTVMKLIEKYDNLYQQQLQQRSSGGDVGAPTRSNANRPQATLPSVGEVRGGFRYKGGNPSNQNSWVKVQ